MGLLKLLAVLALLAAGAAYFTRPGEAEFDALLREQIRERIAGTDIGTGEDALATVALIGCKLRPSDCFEVVRGGLDVTFEDRTLYTSVHVRGFGREAACTGAFTRFWCGDLLAE